MARTRGLLLITRKDAKDRAARRQDDKSIRGLQSLIVHLRFEIIIGLVARLLRPSCTHPASSENRTVESEASREMDSTGKHGGKEIKIV